MEILELHHVSLPATDLDRSRRFYREVLGLEEIPRPAFPFPGAWFRLGLRGGELHLIGGDGARSQGGTGTDPRQLHFAVRVASFAAALARVRGLGYREDLDPADPLHLAVRERPPTGYPQLYLCDPDRHLVEVNAALPEEG